MGFKDNPRITAKERNNIKGALRQAFSRSDLRRSIINKTIDKDYFDRDRIRVKTWSKCTLCERMTPKSYMVVDHINPVVPVTSSFEEMSLDDFIDALWCEPSNLQACCNDCHAAKSSSENKERAANKRARRLSQKKKKKRK